MSRDPITRKDEERKKKRFPPRGLDFYLRWSIGNWAEEMAYKFCQEIIARELNVRVYRYGYSAGRIPKNMQEFEEILREKEELEKGRKRPNLLLFSSELAKAKEQELLQLMRKPDQEVKDLVKEALLGLEVEHSVWSVKRAKKSLSFTVKEEDVKPLRDWQRDYGIPIVVLQVFLDELHACTLDEVISGKEPRIDSITKKLTYFHPISQRTRLADIEGVKFEAKVEFDENGKLIPFISLVGGEFTNINLGRVRELRKYFKSKA
jgi:hypothetical protein